MHGSHKLKAFGLIVGLAFGTAGCGGIGSDHTHLSLYACNFLSASISQFDINTNGSLTPLSPPTVATVSEPGTRGPASLTFSPKAPVAYLADQVANTIVEYAIGNNGTLKKIGTVSSGIGPSIIVPDPKGKYAYAANEFDNSISQYLINSDGTLKPNGVLAIPNDPGHIVFGPDSQFLYVTSFDGNNISQYPIKANGTLGQAVSTQTTGVGAFASQFSVDQKYLYVSNLGSLAPPYETGGGNTITEFRLNANGSLTSIGTVDAGIGPAFMSVTPDGRYLYVANLHSTTITEFSISTNGTLNKIGTVGGLNKPVQILVDPTGQYAYAPNSGNTNAPTPNDNTVAEFRVNSNGTLTSIGYVPVGSTPDYVGIAAHL